MDKNLEQQISRQCKAMKLKALEMAQGAGFAGSHIGGGFSLMEIMATLMNFVNKDETMRDRVILSKGHGAMALYPALWQQGMIKEEELVAFDKSGSGLYGHPHRNISKGIEFSAGSLALGLSYSVGVAYALKEKQSTEKVYTIVGDGECDEGLVWESLMSASNFNLNNLTVIVDKNGLQLDGLTKEIMDTGSLSDKFRAFGFHVIDVDGHNPVEIWDALSQKSEKPKAIIAKTNKANGISFLENTRDSHHCVLNKKKYQQAVEEIEKSYE